MLRLTAWALALVATFSLLPSGASEAGNRNEKHRIIKHQNFRMIDRNANRYERRHARRVVAKAVVVVKVNGGNRTIRRGESQGNTYSGDVIVNIRNGVGQWSYGSYSSRLAVVAPPKAKIIDVGTLKSGSACQMQAGVCLIKP